MRTCLARLAANVSRSGQAAVKGADSLAKGPFGQQVGVTVYLTHVKWITGKNQLVQYFSRYGPIKNVAMFYDSVTGLHRGFASITFENRESATRAIEQRPHVIDGEVVDLEPYVPSISKQNKKDVVL